MRKLMILFFVVLVLGSTFFCFPLALAAENEEVELEPTWNYTWGGKIDTMNYPIGNPYDIILNTDLTFGVDIEYILHINYSIGIDGKVDIMRKSEQTSFYSDSHGPYYVYWLGSDFPSGTVWVDPDTKVGFGYGLDAFNVGGKLSLHFRLFTPSEGVPATVGEMEFTLYGRPTTRINAYWLNYQSSNITGYTDYLTPVAYFNATVGAVLPVDEVKYITQSDEWYTVLNVKPNTAPTAYYWYNLSGDYIGGSSYPVPAGYKDLILIAWYGDNLFYNQFGKLINFWRSVSTARQQLGFTNGQSAGYNQGYNQGQAAGYNQGYADGKAEGTPTSALGGIVQGVSGMLNIPLFGDFTLGGLIAIILGLCLLFLFLKIFAGG